MRRRVGLALAVAVAGCGGDAGPTRADYIAKGDAICERVNADVADLNDRLARINQGATGAADPDEAIADAAPLLADAHELQQDSLTEFRGLEAPEDDQDEVDDILAGIERQVDAIGELAAAAEAGDAERFAEAAPQIAAARNRVQPLLQDYGFEVCGRA